MDMYDTDIMVSVYCLTYNHEKYIRQALESFVNQKTDFKFEVIVHDDASTDNTAKIIREFEQKYPDIVKPIYQTENQWSKGISVSAVFVYPSVKGKYVAICEGDDYWTDNYKLQKQVDYMESHPKCTLCFHNAIIVDVDNNIVKKSFMPSHDVYAQYYKNVECEYSCDEMILLDFVPTASLMYRACDAKKLAEIPFYFSNISICGDLQKRLYFPSLGYAYYFPEKMSAYRTAVPDSATQRAKQDADSWKLTVDGYLKILDEFNAFTAGRYNKSIQEAKRIKLFLFYFEIGCAYACMNDKYLSLYKLCSRREKCMFFIRSHLNFMCKTMRFLSQCVKK